MEVEHVKAQRSKKEKQQMSLFEQFITEGNERAGELAKTIMDGADQGQYSPAEKRGDLYAACFHCLVEEWHDCEELKPTPKEKWTFVTRSGSEHASHKVVCGRQQIPLREVRKEQ